MFRPHVSLHIYSSFVGSSEMTFVPTKSEKIPDVITYVIWAYQKNESFLYRFLLYMLPRICRSIGRHFKRFVDTLIERT